ncbi:MAG: PilZ domain-containing protein [Paracoccaceae bacterium]
MKYRPRRRVTSFDVVLKADTGSRHAKIVDVTEAGARLQLEFGNLEYGAVVGIGIRGHDYNAKVVWNREGEAGVMFEKPLPLDALSTILHSMRRITPQKKRRFLMG